MLSLNFVILIGVVCFIISFKIKILEKIGVIYLILISSLRYNYGGDYAAYYNYFINIDNNFFNFEIGYFWLNKLFRYFSSNFNLFLMLVSTFNILTFYIIIKKFFYNKVRQLMILYLLGYYSFLFQLVIIRQSIAISIFFISIIFLEKKKVFIYLLLILFASLFHKPIILLAGLYITCYDRFFERKFLISCFFILISLYFFPNIFYFKIFSYISLEKYYYVYFEKDNIGLNYYFLLIIINFVLLCKKEILNNKKLRIYFFMALLYNYFQMWGTKGQWLERMSFYMVHPYIIYLYFSFKLMNKYLLIMLYLFFYLKLNIIFYQNSDNYFYNKFRIIYFEKKIEFEKIKKFKIKKDLQKYRGEKYHKTFKE